MSARIGVAVEGSTDEAVVRRLAASIDVELWKVVVAGGKSTLDRSLHKYLQASRFRPWIVVRDLDREAECPAALRVQLTPDVPHGHHFQLRIAVQEIESWLLADRAGIAAFLSVPLEKVPSDPDRVLHPKHEVVRLANRSKSHRMRADMVPAAGTSSRVGPAYPARLIEFVEQRWNVTKAADRSESLRRCLLAMGRWASDSRASLS